MLWSFACDLECALTGLGEEGITVSSGMPSFSFFILHKGWDYKKKKGRDIGAVSLAGFCAFLLLFRNPSQTRTPFLFPFEIALM